MNRERLLGAHLSTGRGWPSLFARARQLGCNCVQIFGGNPRGWKGRPVSAEAAAACRALAAASGVRELILHAVYLVNLASPRREVVEKSLRVLRRDLVSAARLGVRRMVLHPGSDLGEGGGGERLEKNLRILLPHVPPGCRLLLESMAGIRQPIWRLDYLGSLVRRLGPRTGLCLDSAHLCGQGYDLASPAGWRLLDRDLGKYAGYRRLGCLHVNDSRAPCGSHRDLHENLGEGHVGRRGLIRLLAHPYLRRLPFILETPGFDRLGPDRKNMLRLRRYARAADRTDFPG